MERIKEFLKTPMFITFVIIAVGISVMGFFVLQSKSQTSASQQPYVEYSQINNIPLPQDAKPGITPKVTIEEFGDFQCPACGSLYQSKLIEQTQNKYKDQVKFSFKQFPLVNIHPYAFKEAEASLAAGEQGKFWEMYNILYQNQSQFGNPATGPDESNLVDMAKQIGVSDINKFQTELKKNQFDEAVRKDMSLGDSKKVDSTPTIFINGQKYTGNWTVDSISPEIDKIINS